MVADPQITLIMAQLNKVAESVIKQAATGITKTLAVVTPVDTGFARTNWIPTISTPFEGTIGDRSTLAGINGNTQKTGIAAINANYTISKGKAYVTNNVEYITSLNDGTSKQAPRAFVQQTIAKVLSGITSI